MVHGNEYPVVCCIVGPTASGKTDLAQELAIFHDGEVVSADSMQIYRGMDIGTGKIPEDERMVAHYGLDLVNPGEPFSAALFQEYARTCFRDIASRGKRPFLCGGTGFYVRAAIDAYDFPAGEQVDNPLRERLNDFAHENGAHALWLKLRDADPESAELIPENDVKRVVRAFELLENGTTYARQKRALATLPQLVPAIFIGLSVDPETLRRRIDDRVDGMIRDGLVEEVEGLLIQGFRGGITAPQAIGYKEIVAALDGHCSLDEAIEQIKIATRRYAKRQRTWFRKDKRINWIDASDFDLAKIAAEATRIIEKAISTC